MPARIDSAGAPATRRVFLFCELALAGLTEPDASACRLISEPDTWRTGMPADDRTLPTAPTLELVGRE